MESRHARRHGAVRIQQADSHLIADKNLSARSARCCRDLLVSERERGRIWRQEAVEEEAIKQETTQRSVMRVAVRDTLLTDLKRQHKSIKAEPPEISRDDLSSHYVTIDLPVTADP
ncbi:hypothetical protein J6590_026748 [Homalodisca vitripennis]|nr:hypothetical protein J6590_026748 [Homalodisca vitripennis]